MNALQNRSSATVPLTLAKQYLTCKLTQMTVADADGYERKIGGIVAWEHQREVFEHIVPRASQRYDVVVIGHRSRVDIRRVKYEIHLKPWRINHAQIATALRLAEYQKAGMRRWKFDRTFFERFGSLGKITEVPQWIFAIKPTGAATLTNSHEEPTRLNVDEIVTTIARTFSDSRSRFQPGMRYRSAEDTSKLRLTPLHDDQK